MLIQKSSKGLFETVGGEEIIQWLDHIDGPGKDTGVRILHLFQVMGSFAN